MTLAHPRPWIDDVAGNESGRYGVELRSNAADIAWKSFVCLICEGELLPLGCLSADRPQADRPLPVERRGSESVGHQEFCQSILYKLAERTPCIAYSDVSISANRPMSRRGRTNNGCR